MRITTRTPLIAVAAALVLGLSGCASAGSGTSAADPAAAADALSGLLAECDPAVSESIEGDIQIGVSSALSGPAAAYGASSVGFQAYIDQVNADGGVDGHQIVVTVKDDQLDPAKTASNVNEMISQTGSDLLAVVPGTATNLAVADLLERSCIPNVFALTGDVHIDNTANPWTVKGLPDFDLEIDTLVDNLETEFPDGATVALMYANSEGGNVWSEAMKERLDGTEWAVTEEQTIENAEVGPPTSQVTSLADKADVLFTWLNVGQCAPLLKEVARTSWQPVIYQTLNCFNAGAVMLPAGDAADGVRQAGWLRTFTPEQAKADPALADYIDALTATDASVSPASFASAGYAFGAGVVAVLEQAAASGTLSRASIVEAANSLAPVSSPLLLDGVEFSSGPDHPGFVPNLVVQEWSAADQEWKNIG